MPSTRLALTPQQRAELERRDRSRRGRADAARAAARRDTLVDSVARPPAWGAAYDCRPRLARGRPPAASTRAVYALDRSRLRDESRGRDRALPRSAATRRRLLRR